MPVNANIDETDDKEQGILQKARCSTELEFWIRHSTEAQMTYRTSWRKRAPNDVTQSRALRYETRTAPRRTSDKKFHDSMQRRTADEQNRDGFIDEASDVKGTGKGTGNVRR